MSDDKTQQFPPVSAERIKRRRDVNFDSPDPDDREIAAICQMALDSITPSHVAALTPDWCMDAFWRANPGRNAVVPSLYLLDFAREVLRVHGVQSANGTGHAGCKSCVGDGPPFYCTAGNECVGLNRAAESKN
jgi:hypothetical protein